MTGISWNVGLKERTSRLHPPILPSSWTSIDQCSKNHRFMMTWIQRQTCFGKLSEKTWSSLSMGNQSVFHHYLSNWGCSQQSCSTTSILSQALGTWILVGLYSFMTWSLMKKLIFAHISSTSWARLLRELPQGTAFLFIASFQKFWSSKAFIHWKMSTLILSKVWLTFTLSMLSSVTAKRESSRRVMLLIVVQALAHIPMLRS